MKFITQKYRILLIGFLMTSVLYSCKKYLDEVPNKGIAIITKLSDLQQILDNPIMTSSYFSLATGAADEYYLPSYSWDVKQADQRDAYIWKGSTNIDAWSQPYQIVYSANVALDEVDKLTGGDKEKDKIKGQALFYRAFAFYHIAQLYCKPYSPDNLSAPGIVLRLTSTMTEKSVRSSVKDTYSKIIADLREAAELLEPVRETVNRPNAISAYGALARVYLSMSDYENAAHYAQLYLDLAPELLDFNNLDTLANPPIGLENIEVTFYSYMEGFTYEEGLADTVLYTSYADNDLRRSVYYYDPGDGTKIFKGSYAGFYGTLPFCGIATDEIYLIRAECAARADDPDLAMHLLNGLLSKRHLEGTFTELTAANPAVALEHVLTERRKELVYRGTRWSDIRRLNLEGRNITLKRNLNGQSYELPPNDPRSTWLIPKEVITLSGIEQNER